MLIKYSPSTYLLEICLREFVSYSKQIPTCMCVRKGTDAKTIRRVQLPLEKFATYILDLR